MIIKMILPGDILKHLVSFIDTYETLNNLSLALRPMYSDSDEMINDSLIWIHNKPKKYKDLMRYMKYTSLRYMVLRDVSDTNALRDISRALSHTLIHTIRIKNDQIDTLIKDYQRFSDIRSLYMCNGSMLPQYISLLHKIEVLYLGDNSSIASGRIDTSVQSHFLKHLHLGNDSKIQDNDLIPLIKCFDALEILHFGNNSLLTDKSMMFLGNIKALNIGDNSRITDQGLMDLISMHGIKELRIGKNCKYICCDFKISSPQLNVYLYDDPYIHLHDDPCTGHQSFMKKPKYFKRPHVYRGTGLMPLIACNEKKDMKKIKCVNQSIKYCFTKHIKNQNHRR
jgi:hypothetical protein